MNEQRATPQMQQEGEKSIKNYTRVANMLVDGYQELLPQEKWLYMCLIHLCGREGMRFLSLRYLSERTGFSLGALSASKKTGSPGMLWRLHQAGLVQVEIKKRRGAGGEERRHAQFHITITDIWQKNAEFFDGARCSTSEHFREQEEESVRKVNARCSEVEHNRGQSVRKSSAERSDSSTKVRLQSKITYACKITEAEEGLDGSASQPEHTAAAQKTFFYEHVTEEEIALLQAYRQGRLTVDLPGSQNLEVGAIEEPNKQAESVLYADEPPAGEAVPESVFREPLPTPKTTLLTKGPATTSRSEPLSCESPAVEAVSPGVPLLASKTTEGPATTGSGEPMPFVRPTTVGTAEAVVQLWEWVRQERYGVQERVGQLRAATTLLGMELPTPLTVEVLERLYTTYFDDFWKQRYGELHLSHLVETEKSSGQVRVQRWLKRLRFQSLPRAHPPGAASGETPPTTTRPTMDFANYRQEEERDLVQLFAEGKLSEKELAAYPPAMRVLLKRHAAARMVEKVGNQ